MITPPAYVTLVVGLLIAATLVASAIVVNFVQKSDWRNKGDLRQVQLSLLLRLGEVAGNSLVLLIPTNGSARRRSFGTYIEDRSFSSILTK